MSRFSRFLLATILLGFAWTMAFGFEADSVRQRLAGVRVGAFALVLAAGLAFPTRLRVALRLAAGAVALGYLWYFVSQLAALLRGEPQPLAVGRPSAFMAGVGLLVFGVPALAFALGGTTVGWLDRLLRRARGESAPDEPGPGDAAV